MSVNDCTEGFATPETLIDTIHPVTGLSWCFGETLDQINRRYPGAVKVSIADWCKAKGERMTTPIIWEDTTREKYWEMLEVLPPAAMCGNAFLVGEPMDHRADTGEPRFTAFRQIGFENTGNATYLVASRPITHREFKAELEATSPGKNLAVRKMGYH